MAGLRQPFSRWLAIGAAALLLAACSQMGRQQPAVFGGKFSAGGKYYAYIYQSVFIFSYQRTGGRTISNGTSTHYLQLVDAETGRKLLAKPLKPIDFDCRHPDVGDVSNTHVLVACSDDAGKPQAPMVFSIAAQTVSFTSRAIRERNPGLPVDAVHVYDFYRSDEDPGAFFVEGKDGRKYRLDPQTGAAQVAAGKFWRPDADDQLDGQLTQGLSEAGDGRRYIKQGQWAELQRSQEDFLAPKYLHLDRGDHESFAPATLHDGGILVLSRTEKDSGQHKRLTLVDAATLTSRWSTALPQDHGDWANDFDNERFVLQGDQLLVANSSQLLRIDLATGKIVRNTSLLESP